MAVDSRRVLLFPLLALCQTVVVAQEEPLISRTEEIVEAEPIERTPTCRPEDTRPSQ